MKCLLFMVATLLSLSAVAHADTIYVPADQPTIQAGIHAAANGDTVVVSPGTYVENIYYLGKAITIKSELGPDVTVLDGNQAGSVVSFVLGEGTDSVLEGFTITNGSGTLQRSSPGGGIDGREGNYYGGGIYCVGASPTVSSNIIEGNSVVSANMARGGGICCLYDASPIIKDNIIRDNFASDYGGGIHGYVDCHALVTGNEIVHNRSGYDGGGVYITYSNSILDGNLISENQSSNSGAGIYCSYDSVITNNLITANVAGGSGGGIYGSGSSEPTIMYNEIDLNVAAYGGGIYCGGINARIAENRITNNQVSHAGGGIGGSNCDPVIERNLIAGNYALNTYSQGGGIYLHEDCHTEILGNIIRNNHAQTGGGIGCSKRSTTFIEDNILYENSASEMGGAVYLWHCAAKIRNNMIFRNEALTNGGAIYCAQKPQNVINNTVYANEAGNKGGGAYFEDCTATVANNIFWNDVAGAGSEIDQYLCTLNISYCDFDDAVLAGYPNCFQADPMFADPAQNDFHLTYQSPCVGAGDNNAASLPFKDFEGDGRIKYGVADVGADEFYRHLYITGDQTPGGDIEGKFVGLPGMAPVYLVIGSGVLDPPKNTIYGDLYLLPPRTLIPLIPIPANGILAISTTIPLTPPAPYDVPMQGLVGLGPNSFTNLCVLEIR